MAQKTAWDGIVLTESDINTYLSGEGGAWTSWTPAVVQSGAVTTTNTRSRYGRWGRLIEYNFSVAVTGSGTGANAITVSLPATAAAAGIVIGQGFMSDSSTGNFYPFLLYMDTTATCQLMRTSTDATAFTLGTVGFTDGLASGDGITGTGVYEAAS